MNVKNHALSVSKHHRCYRIIYHIKHLRLFEGQEDPTFVTQGVWNWRQQLMVGTVQGKHEKK